MTKLVLEPTATAQWQTLVLEASTRCARRLDETLESYLVFLLMRFIGRPELAARVLALEFLEGLNAPGRLRHERLRDVGDQCLLYSGLFPRRAERRLVRISYFVDLGRAAYGRLADGRAPGEATLYAHLARGFVALMEVLQAMCTLTGTNALDLLQAVELWQDTGSGQALQGRLALADLPLSGDRDRRAH